MLCGAKKTYERHKVCEERKVEVIILRVYRWSWWGGKIWLLLWKKGKVKGNSLEETILTSLHVRSPPHLSCIVRRAQSRQPATSASLPTNRHARLRLCAVLSVSAAEAGRRGTATPNILPGMLRPPLRPFFPPLQRAISCTCMQFLLLVSRDGVVADAYYYYLPWICVWLT